MKFLDDTRLAIQQLSMNDWNLINDNYLKLNELVNDDDRHHFPTNIMDFGYDEQLQLTSQGWQCLKKYKLKEDVTQVDIARRRIKLYVLKCDE